MTSIQALRKEPMTVYGDGKQTRSFQYVSDLVLISHLFIANYKKKFCCLFLVSCIKMKNAQVDGLVALMEGEHIGPFNLGNPGEFTMLELAEVSYNILNQFTSPFLP